MLTVQGSNFRLGGIAPITRAVPSFSVLMRLVRLSANTRAPRFSFQVESLITELIGEGCVCLAPFLCIA